MNSSSVAQNNARDAKPQRQAESATTKAYDFWIARKAGLRLPEHRLPGDKP